MKRLEKIGFILGILALAAGLLFITGCGGDEQKTSASTIACDEKAPSIIPAPSGRPQLVEFYRDT